MLSIVPLTTIYHNCLPVILTLKCKGGIHLDPAFCFLRLLLKREKIFLPLFCNCLNISYASIGEKNDIGCPFSRVISINKHYCATWLNLFWPPFLKKRKQKTFFNFYSKNVNVLMFLTLNQILIKIPFRKWFLKVWSRDYIRETEIHFLASIWNGTFFECSHCWFMVVLGVYRYGESFVPKFIREST